MNIKISSERIEILTKIGFGNVPDCDPSFAFGTFALALNTNMIVRGEHADDIAYIYYTCIEIDERIYDGLFYAPSLLEHPYLNYQIFDVNKVLDKINQYAFCDAEYICVGGIHMIFVPICDYEWKVDIKTPLSDMLKIVGILDYFLTHEYEKRAEI